MPIYIVRMEEIDFGDSRFWSVVSNDFRVSIFFDFL